MRGNITHCLRSPSWARHWEQSLTSHQTFFDSTSTGTNIAGRVMATRGTVLSLFVFSFLFFIYRRSKCCILETKCGVSPAAVVWAGSFSDPASKNRSTASAVNIHTLFFFFLVLSAINRQSSKKKRFLNILKSIELWHKIEKVKISKRVANVVEIPHIIRKCSKRALKMLKIFENCYAKYTKKLLNFTVFNFKHKFRHQLDSPLCHIIIFRNLIIRNFNTSLTKYVSFVKLWKHFEIWLQKFRCYERFLHCFISLLWIYFLGNNTSNFFSNLQKCLQTIRMGKYKRD